VTHDPNQDGLPGMIIALPTNRTPEPEPDSAPTKPSRGRRRKPGREINPDFIPSPKSVATIRDEFPYVTDEVLRFQLRRFIDHHLQRGTLMRDEDAAWRNWMRIADERGDLRRRNSRPIAASDRRVAEVASWA
jgi:hypothetical protein